MQRHILSVELLHTAVSAASDMHTLGYCLDIAVPVFIRFSEWEM